MSCGEAQRGATELSLQTGTPDLFYNGACCGATGPFYQQVQHLCLTDEQAIMASRSGSPSLHGSTPQCCWATLTGKNDYPVFHGSVLWR